MLDYNDEKDCDIVGPGLVCKLDIQLFNRDVMEDCAWTAAFGEKVPYPLRFTISAMTIAQHVFGGSVPKTELDAAVCIQANVSRPTARKYIKSAVKKGYLISGKSMTNDNSEVYTCAHDLPAKMKQVNTLRQKITIALAAQAKDPQNNDAGAEHLPEEVYANYADPELTKLVRKALTDKANELKASSKSKGRSVMAKSPAMAAIAAVAALTATYFGIDPSWAADTADFVGRVASR